MRDSVARNITRHLQTGRYWLTASLTLVEKDYQSVRCLKHLINRIVGAIFGKKLFYRDLEGGAVLQSLQRELNEVRSHDAKDRLIRVFTSVTRGKYNQPAALLRKSLGLIGLQRLCLAGLTSTYAPSWGDREDRLTFTVVLYDWKLFLQSKGMWDDRFSYKPLPQDRNLQEGVLYCGYERATQRVCFVKRENGIDRTFLMPHHSQQEIEESVGLEKRELIPLSEERDPNCVRCAINQYMRYHLGEGYKKQHLLHKVWMLQQVKEECLQDREGALALQSAALHIYQSLEKLQKSFSSEEINSIESVLKEFHIAIRGKFSEEQNLFATCDVSHDLGQFPIAIQTSTFTKRRTASRATSFDVRSSLWMEGISSQGKGLSKEKMELLFQEGFSQIKSLEEAQRFEEADQRREEMLFFVTEEFLTTLSLQEKERWADAFLQLGRGFIDSYFLLGRESLPPVYIASLLKAALFANLLIQRPPFLDLEFLEVGLKDPYLDLGVAGPEIQALLSRWRKIEGIRNSPQKTPQERGLKELYQLMHVTLMGAWCLTTIPPSTRSFFERWKSRKEYIDDRAQVRKCLASVVTKRVSLETRGNDTVLEPFGLFVLGPVDSAYANNLYQHTVAGQISSYERQRKQVRESLIRESIVTSVVALHDAGQGEDGGVANYRSFRYQGAAATQGEIQEGSLGAFQGHTDSFSQALQLMQTAPLDRVRNTLLVFAENPHLLRNSDWQRVFSLNFFRSAYFFKLLQKDQAFLSELLPHLTTLWDRLEALYKESPNDSLEFGAELIAKIYLMVMEAEKQGFIPQGSSDLLRPLRRKVESSLDKEVEELEGKLIKGELHKVSEEQIRKFQAFLMVALSDPQISDETVIKVVRRWFFLKGCKNNPYYREELLQIERKMLSLSSRVDGLIEKGVVSVEHLTALKIELKEKEASWRKSAAGIWSRGQYTVSIGNGEVLRRSLQKHFLPMVMRKKIEGLLTKEELAKSFDTETFVEEGSGNVFSAASFTLKTGALCSLFYQEEEGVVIQEVAGKRYQRQEECLSEEVRNRLPTAIGSATVWAEVGGNGLLFCDEEGSILFRGELAQDSDGRIVACHLKKEGQEEDFLFAASHTERTVFGQIGPVKECLIEEGGRIISYPRLQLSYKRDPETQRWESTSHPGFFLIERSIQSLVRPLSKREPSEEGPSLFRSHFTRYHILSNGVQNKLLLPGVEIASRRAEEVGISKHLRSIETLSNTSQETLYTFDITQEGQLIATSGEGYLYLAYLLYTQKKHTEALHYLRQAFLRMEGPSEERERLISYFRNWNPTSPADRAVMAHLAYYELELERFLILSGEETLERDASKAWALDLYSHYKEEELQVPVHLRCSLEIEESLRLFAPRCSAWMVSKIRQAAGEALPFWEEFARGRRESQDFDRAAFKHYLEQELQDYRNRAKENEAKNGPQYEQQIEKLSSFLGDFDRRVDAFIALSNEYLFSWDVLQYYAHNSLIDTGQKRIEEMRKLASWCLQREVESRSKQLKTLKDPPVIEVIQGDPTPIFGGQKEIERSLLSPKESSRQEEQESLGKKKEVSTLSDEIRQEIELDMAAYQRQQAILGEIEITQEVFTVESVTKLSEQLQTAKSEARAKQLALSQKIIHYFQIEERGASFSRMLREEEPTMVPFFEEALFCFGEGDFSPLVEKGVIQESSIPQLKELYQEWCLASSSIQQIEKIERQLHLCSQKKDSMELAKLGKLLSQRRYYNPEAPLYGSRLLVLEVKLQIVCNELQVKNIIAALQHPSSFQHHAWGGGKTTVLRHLIASLRGSSGDLGSLLTHAPLLQSHHRKLRETSASTYGKISRFVGFSRETPTDPISLRRELLKLMVLMQQKGISDQTIHQWLSLRHAFSLAMVQFDERHPNREEHWESLQVFDEILKFREEHMALGTDEADAVLVEQRNNYATGSKEFLSEEVYAPATVMMDLILTKETYTPFRPFFLSRQLKDLTEEQRKEFLALLSKDLVDVYQLQEAATLEELQKLWGVIPAEDREKEGIFQKIRRGEKAKIIQTITVYLESVIPLSFHKVCGADYGRSMDGIQTKPYSDSTVCLEKSQYSSIHLLVWLSCLDYMRHQISEPVAALYIERMLTRAAKEAANEKVDISQTETFLRMKKEFGVDIRKNSKEEAPKILGALKEKPEKIKQILVDIHLGTIAIYPRQLSGHSKQLSYEVHTLSGSSGNCERVLALPRKMELHPGIRRQREAMGMVTYNLRHKTKPEDYVYDGRDPREILKDLKKGEAFIDAGAWFAGVSSEECAQIITSATGHPVRFIDSSGKTVILMNNTKEIIAAEDCAFTPADYITFYGHKDRRGVDLELPLRSRNLMTVGHDMDLTNFSQSVCRLRKWGQGQECAFLIDSRMREQQRAWTSELFLEMLIHNEERNLQKLHTQAVQQEIVKFSEGCVYQMLRQIKDPYQFIPVRNLARELGYLDQPASSSLEVLSYPKQKRAAREVLGELAKREREKLLKLQNLVVQVCGEESLSLKRGIQGLEDDSLIIEERYLSPQIASGEMELEAIEEVEVEVEAEVAIEEVEEVEEVEVSREIEAEEESEETIEPERIRDRVRSHYVFRPSLQASRSLNIVGVGKISFTPDLFLQGYGIAFLNDRMESPQLLASSMLITVGEDGLVESLMGTVKDADTCFGPSQWREGGKIRIHYKFLDKRPLDEVLRGVPKKYRETIKKQMVLGKLIYGLGLHLSEEEREIFEKSLSTSLFMGAYGWFQKMLEYVTRFGTKEDVAEWRSLS